MGGKNSNAPKTVDPVEQANAQMQAQLASIPRAAQLQYDVLANPNYGVTATNQLYESMRKQLYPEETNVRNQLTSNVLESLMNPSGLNAGMQTAQDESRALAREQTQRDLRSRSNLGGNLYSGTAIKEEGQRMGDLNRGFSLSDITQQQQNQQNASSLALSILQLLYPDTTIQQPSYVNPVASADTAYSGAVSQANAQNSYQQQQQANNNALYASLFSTLGSLGGAAIGSLGGPAGAMAGSTLGSQLGNFAKPQLKGSVA